MYPRKTPERPTVYYGNEFKITPKDAPPWISPIVSLILVGSEHSEAVNSISCNSYGDLELYRRITVGDRKNYPQLEGVAEVWITCDLPSSNFD